MSKRWRCHGELRKTVESDRKDDRCDRRSRKTLGKTRETELLVYVYEIVAAMRQES